MGQRFSDAELAAEYRFALGELYIGAAGLIAEWFGGPRRFKETDTERVVDQTEALYRFATLPHAHPENLVNANTKETP